MAEFKVVKTEAKEKKTLSDHIEGFLVSYRVVILAVLGALLCAAIAAAAVSGITESRHKSGLGKIDSISAELTGASGSDYAAAAEKALTALEEYTASKSIVGVRANMLKAEILFKDKKWAEARDAWLKAAESSKKAYTAPLALFNAAVCCEELGETADAIAYYEQAASNKDFSLKTHAAFNAGRIKDEAGDYEGAAAAYQELADNHGDDSWANVAMTRLIALRAEGKAQ